MRSSLSWTSVWYITLVEGTCSWILFRMPTKFFFQDFHDHQLLLASGSVVACGVYAWFLLGAYKTAMMIAWDPNASYFRSFRQQMKSLLLVPLAPMIRFRPEWYRLPKDGDTQQKDE